MIKIPDSNKLISVAIIIGIVLALIIVINIMKAAGIMKTAAEKKAAANNKAAVEDLQVSTYFDPEYFRSQSGYSGLTVTEATKYAKDLRDAMAGLGTDEQAIYITFGKLPSKIAISEVSSKYKDQYGFPWYIMSDNLQKDLLNELNEEETGRLMQIISSLPNK